jgi:uncharacterized protein (TIGR02271 family)
MRTPIPTPTEADLSIDAPAPAIHETSHGQERLAEEVIPLMEEEVRVGKREITTGKVRVHTRVDVMQETVNASLQEETVEVTRVPMGHEISQAPEVRTENGVTIVPVIEEVLVVEKRLVLKEELHIRRTTRTEDVEIPVELRKQRAEVERIPAGTKTSHAADEET